MLDCVFTECINGNTDQFKVTVLFYAVGLKVVEIVEGLNRKYNKFGYTNFLNSLTGKKILSGPQRFFAALCVKKHW